MTVLEKKLDEIKPYERNPRKNDNAVKYVAKSIEQFGFKVPIVIDKDGIIVAGHTRYKAAKYLMLETVPCIVADDLTDEQIKAFRLADNKVSEFATWDFELLNSELDVMQEFDIDMADFGFYNSFDENAFDDMFDDEADEMQQEEEQPEEIQYGVVIRAYSEARAKEIFEELQEYGYECEVKNL